MDLGAAIKAAREGAGKTQVELAEAIERTQVYVSFLECGRRAPSDACLAAIATALGTTARSLRTKAAGFAPRDDRAKDQRAAKALGEAIRAVRSTVGRTQREVAESAEIEPAYLAQIEGGRSRPSEALLDRIAAEIKTTARSLRQRATTEIGDTLSSATCIARSKRAAAKHEQAAKRREERKTAEQGRAAKRREKREAKRAARAARRREIAEALAAKRRESARVRREKERAARAARKRKRAAKRAEERAVRRAASVARKRETAKARAAERKTKKRAALAARKAAKREREAKRAEERAAREAERPLREAEKRAEQERRLERKKAEREAEQRGREARRNAARRRALGAGLTPSAGDIESLAEDLGMRAPRRIAGSDLGLPTGLRADVGERAGEESFWSASDDMEEFQVSDADEGPSVLMVDDDLDLLRPRKVRAPKPIDYVLADIARKPVRRSAGRAPRSGQWALPLVNAARAVVEAKTAAAEHEAERGLINLAWTYRGPDEGFSTIEEQDDASPASVRDGEQGEGR